MNKEELKNEQRTLSLMSKTLTNIIKDVAPVGGRPNPLKDSTTQDIKDCFTLILEREKELTEKLGVDKPKPHSANVEQPNKSVLNFVKLSKRR